MIKRTIKTSMLAAVLLFFTGTAVITMVFIRQSLNELPPVSKLESYVPPLASKVLDAYGETIGEFFIERRINVSLTQIPLDLKHAVMATEDTHFYEHWGIDIMGIFRAALANIKAGRVVQGGSTLTQQLAKTIFLTRQKTFTRKFKELLLTLQIEFRYSKDEILELYLNQIYFGAGAYGVQAATQLYFDKNASEINLAESAMLAGLIKSPNRYSPLRNPELAVKRRSLVLTRMRKEEYITELEEKEANESPVVPEEAGGQGRQAHYFLEEIRKTLDAELGTETLEQSGLTIQTTLDLKMQQAAEEVLEKHLSEYDLKFGTATLKEYNDELIAAVERDREILIKSTYTRTDLLIKSATEQVEISTIPPKIQGALVALDVHTGAIRAMVGGRDFYKSQFNRAVQAKRQPGSSFKPFVWAAALEDPRFTAATVIDDYPLVYIDMESEPTLLTETTSYAQTWEAILKDLNLTQEEFDELEKEEQKELMKQYWRPQNYDARYLGSMTLLRGLQKSRNVLAVRIIDSIGPRKVLRLARKAGITGRLSPVLSMSLGTSVVSLLELTNSFATFASGGLFSKPYYIERILDRRGKIVAENTPEVEARINPQTAFLTTTLLQAVVERGTGWYAKRLRRALGGKTGTTQDQRDLLFIGFSPDLAAGVWVGYDDFRPLKNGLSSSKIAVPLWTDFMREALKNYPPKEFPIPPQIEYAKIDAETGYLALPTCPNVVLQAFRRGTIPVEFCPIDHYADKKDIDVDNE